MFRGIVFAAILGSSVACGADRVVWQIGAPDRNYKDLAIPGDYGSYAKRFGAKPVVFEVGRSKAQTDWPFIQPGPGDFWAGSMEHPHTIRFTLPDEPAGVYTLRIDLVDVHMAATPVLKVAIGGREGVFRFPPGGGDASLTDPKNGNPQKIEIPIPALVLKRGLNEIALTIVDGSWVLYDAVTLRNDPAVAAPRPELQSVTVAPTPFHVRRDGKIRRAIDVALVATATTEPIALRVEAGGETFTTTVRQTAFFGAVQEEVSVPDVDGPLEVKATATVAGRSKTATAVVSPQRKWKIFVAPSAHTDVGYTDIQPKCVERHNENTDRAVELCERYPEFRWNLEVAWQAENYVNARSGSRLERFLKLARADRIGVQALYCNILTGLCSHEEACRLMALAHDLHRRYGIPYRSAMISDVPSQEASLPMILANSGIRYFSSGINNDRAYPFSEMYAKCPAWWEGPDGSRVLMMWMPGYAHAAVWGLDRSVSAARASVLANIKAHEGRPGYVYDAIFLHGACSDNQPLNPGLAEVVKAWNQRYEYPKILLGNNADFFEYIEKRYGDKLPVYRGSGGTYWEDGAGSSARETTLVRNAHESAANAEKFTALARRIDKKAIYPAGAFASAWRNILLYDEHTWGAHCSISQPESDFTKAQWKIKAQFAVDADRQSQSLLQQSARALASLVRTAGPSLVVLNPTNWPRTDVFQVKLPKGVAIDEPGVVACDTTHGTYALVRDVPACGYRVLRLNRHAGTRPQAQAQPGRATALESPHYRVAFDAAGGFIAGIVDKETGKELVDGKSPHRMNQYVYVAGGKGSQIVSTGPAPKLTVTASQKASLTKFKLGELGEMMVVETSGVNAPKITSTVTVWNDVKRVDFANHLTKTLTYDKEGVYFAFPFAADKPKVRYEIPVGVVCANTDMLPGACLDWFTVQHFVEIDRGDASITWATPDAPLVCFQDVNRGKWQTKLDFRTGHVFAYVMNNYWHTNYLAGQGGEHVFRFALTSGAKSDRVASARFGWDASNPLLAVPVDANQRGPLAEPAASLVSVDEPNVIVIGARKATVGDGLMVRLWEVSGKATTAHVRLHGAAVKKATACNLVEAPQGDVEVKQGAVCVPIRASGLATVIVE
jgi:alpha-mannosidase